MSTTSRPHTTPVIRTQAIIVATVLVLAALPRAAAGPLPSGSAPFPSRSEWRASSSSGEQPGMGTALAIDGDPATRWGGTFSPHHWFQVDLGRAAAVGGVLIKWDLAFAVAYTIETSEDGRRWQRAYETDDSRGGDDAVFFPMVRARYVRIASVPTTADWGVGIWEFEPIAAGDAPIVSGVAGEQATIWSNGPARAVVTAGAEPGTRELTVRLPRAIPVAGIEAVWGAARSGATLAARDASGTWETIAEDPDPDGDRSFLAARAARTARELRLTVRAAKDVAPAITRLRLLGPSQVLTAMKRYQVAASRRNRALFPSSLHAQQVYWTAVGVPGGRQKSVFDEYGDLEAFKAAPLVQPVWRGRGGPAVAAYGRPLEHALRNRWMPMPSVAWFPESSLQLRSEGLATGASEAPVTWVRHRLLNRGAQRIEGRLSLVVRPIQMSPPWQNGGPSPIRTIAIEAEGDPARPVVRVNGRVLLVSATPVAARGAAPFGAHGEGEITRFVADGTVPPTLAASDDDGLAAAVLSYDVALDPGESRDVIVAFPLAAAGPAAVPEGTSFDALAAAVEADWNARVGRIGLTLPDASLVDMLRAQACYMLINQTGFAMQPGPRNYNRSFIRDGSATAAVLLRFGMAQTARDYLRWYAEHAVHDDGLVSPILDEDGRVNRGFGSDLEYDSQGEFVWLVAQIARLDGGAATVREYAPKVRLALKFLDGLRERTLAPGYMDERPGGGERFRGLLAPSISHEGYATPTHSYWDDFFGLLAWHDGAWLADQWGDAETAAWARERYEAFRKSLAASIRATMAWKGIDTIPAAADLGDPDPTGVSIGLDPCGQQDLLPHDALLRTFERYLDDIRRRESPGVRYAYTPYEMRNVLTFVRLDRPRDAEWLLQRFLAGRQPPAWQVLAEVVNSDVRRAIYLGDMPHTWIGAEYARAVFGMLFHEGDDTLELLPGAPPSWVAGDGLRIDKVPTAFGPLSLSARQAGSTLTVTLGPGLRDGVPLVLKWPSRTRPVFVRVDGHEVTAFDASGMRLARPFRELVARW